MLKLFQSISLCSLQHWLSHTSHKRTKLNIIFSFMALLKGKKHKDTWVTKADIPYCETTDTMKTHPLWKAGQTAVSNYSKTNLKTKSGGKYILLMFAYFEVHRRFSWPVLWDDTCFPYTETELHAYIRAPCTNWGFAHSLWCFTAFEKLAPVLFFLAAS